MNLINQVHNFNFYHTKPRSLLVVGLILVAIISTSCNYGRSSTPTLPFDDNVATSTATIVQIDLVTAVPPPLNGTKPKPTSYSQAAHSQIKMKDYNHPYELFSLKYPETWVVNQEDSTVSFIDPKGEDELHIQVIHTGYQLDDDSFLRLTEAREDNISENYFSYFLIDKKVEYDNGLVFFQKQIISNDSPTNELTWYQQQGEVIFVMDFRSNSDDFEVLRETFDIVRSSIEFHNESISSFDAHLPNEQIHYTNDVYDIQVPSYWKKTVSTGDSSVVDTFTSPDQRAIIQIVVYDDGELISKSVAGDFVLYMLQNFYSRDIEITSDTVLPDGRERLFWISESGNYQGVTYFNTRDTTLHILTVIWENDYKIYYENMIDLAIDSLITP